jgi:hypothetical protein
LDKNDIFGTFCIKNDKLKQNEKRSMKDSQEKALRIFQTLHLISIWKKWRNLSIYSGKFMAAGRGRVRSAKSKALANKFD